MEFMTIVVSLLVFAIVVILLAPFGERLDLKQKRLEQINKVAEEIVDEELSRPFTERFLLPMFYAVIRSVSKLYPKSDKKDKASKLEKELKLAGIKMTVREFSAFRIIAMFSCIGLSFIPMLFKQIPVEVRLLVLLFGTVLSVLIPRYYLQGAIKKRQEGIRVQMPDILDLLSVSVEAGLGFDAALVRVSEKAEGPLVEELTTVFREMQMGRPRRDSLKDLGERSSVEELKTFASSLVQADQLGISIRNVLSAQSDQLRLTRKQRAEEKAMKAPVKMMLPLVIFIFPVIFIILLGPSLIEIMNTFGG